MIITKIVSLSCKESFSHWLLLTILNLIFELIQMYHKHDFSLGELSYNVYPMNKISYEINVCWFEISTCRYLLIFQIWFFNKGGQWFLNVWKDFSCWWNPLLKIWSLHKGWNFCSLCVCTALIYDPTWSTYTGVFLSKKGVVPFTSQYKIIRIFY